MESTAYLEPVDLYEDYRECPECGYELGFQTSVLKESGYYLIILVCPNCGAQYEIGWT